MPTFVPVYNLNEIIHLVRNFPSKRPPSSQFYSSVKLSFDPVCFTGAHLNFAYNGQKLDEGNVDVVKNSAQLPHLGQNYN